MPQHTARRHNAEPHSPPLRRASQTQPRCKDEGERGSAQHCRSTPRSRLYSAQTHAGAQRSPGTNHGQGCTARAGSSTDAILAFPRAYPCNPCSGYLHRAFCVELCCFHLGVKGHKRPAGSGGVACAQTYPRARAPWRAAGLGRRRARRRASAR